MEVFIVLLIIGLVVGWILISARFRDLEERLANERRASEGQISNLTQRVHRLEGLGKTIVAAAPVVEPVVVAPVVVAPVVVEKTRAVVPICQFCGRSIVAGAATCVCRAVPMADKPAGMLAPQETLRDQLRRKAGEQEWEALVGGNWLNKIGVLLFVIGIALLLGYEFSRVGAARRVAIGIGVSLTMLIGGVVVERRPLYRIFARGLIGGGWAALYFTTYGLYALPQIKVIENPIFAAVLLLGVAVGMIVHSLKYRSQTVSGLAYFIAFATLGLGENTAFAVLALIPLAASMLFVAHRFDWYKMAVFGVVATYATCAMRPDTGAPLGSIQALFAAYWVLFEAFDLMRVRKRAAGMTVESLILSLNALGFLGLSVVKWHRMAHPHLWAFLAAGAAAYLVSALVRVRLSAVQEGAGVVDRMAAGSYEGPITLASALAAISIFLKAPGVWIDVGLLIEGEVLFLAGWRFGQTYLQQLAGGVFSASVINLLAADLPAGGTFAIANQKWLRFSPVAILMAGCFYFNRAMKVAEGAVYSSVAAGLIALVLGFETFPPYLCVAWMLFAAMLFELKTREFRYQSYVVGGLGTGAGLLVNLLPTESAWHYRQSLPLAIVAAVHYWVALRIRFGARKIEAMVEWFTSAAAVAFLMGLVWKIAPGEYLGVAWLAAGALVFELGLRRLPGYFRELSYVMSAAGFLNLFYFHVILTHKGSAWPLMVAALVCCAVSARLFPSMPAEISDEERGWARDLNAAVGTLFALALAWVLLPAPLVALAWAAIGVVLLEIGFTFSVERFMLLGNLTGAAAFGRLFLANFTDLGNTWRISHRMLTVVPIVVSQYYAWWRYRVRAYLWGAAILAVALMRFELGRSMAVVGWALLGLVLYRTGLVRKIADLRWQSFFIAMLAFWRCWNTDFSIPWTGVAVIVCFYTAQVLSPREGEGLEQHARTFYSVLASVLLAVLLFYEVSGGVLTMAWGVEGLALLAAGFPLRDRLQRLSGLFLFLVCVMKLFFYDLRELGTFNRILSFIVLGAILIAVSWIYTRFRDRIQRYL
jgi:Predicted membrane protein (DUF2339)